LSGSRSGTLPPRPEFDEQVRRFADEQTNLLNRTITDGVRLTPILQEDDNLGFIGYRISRVSLTGEAIPVSLTRAPAKCYLRVLHTFRLDDERMWLMNVRSTFGLYADGDAESVVCHYDYDREPDHPYPAAHIQVAGESEALRTLCRQLGKELQLGRLHFPVGGRRFRPSLEDLIELLISEGIVTGRSGWRDAIAEHRARYERKQLGAAVRRAPDIAVIELLRMNYTVREPER
jgi:hypothetical protein